MIFKELLYFLVGVKPIWFMSNGPVDRSRTRGGGQDSGGISWPFCGDKMPKNTLYPEHVLFLNCFTWNWLGGLSAFVNLHWKASHMTPTCTHVRPHTHARSLITNVVCRLINYHYHQFYRVSNIVISEF